MQNNLLDVLQGVGVYLAIMPARTRTRTHCPNCGNAYPPRARTCPLCGRVRDQISDAEMQPKAMPPAVVFPPTNITANRHQKQKTPLWAWIVGGIIGVWIIGGIIAKPNNSPKPPPTPVAYVPTTAEKAADAKEKAADAKFWAEKAKREADEAKQAEAQSTANNYPSYESEEDISAQTQEKREAEAAMKNFVATQHTYRTGAVCKDGTLESATGRGACSHHGGVHHWLY